MIFSIFLWFSVRAHFPLHILFLWHEVYAMGFLFVCFRPEVWLFQKWFWTSGLAFLPFFFWSNHHVYKSECTLHNQKCVSFSGESLWLPNTTQMAVWGTVSPNRNKECGEMFPLRHLPETCWCSKCRKIFGNSHVLGSAKCCFINI